MRLAASRADYCLKPRRSRGFKDEKQRKSLLKAAIAQDLSFTQIKEKIAKLKAAEVQGDEGRRDKKATYPQILKEIYQAPSGRELLRGNS